MNLYKLQNDAKPGIIGGAPFIIGSALRVPSYAYENWDISGDQRELSLTAYQDEFAETSPEWMKSVVEAANKGGIGNRPQMLRDKVGKAAAQLTKRVIDRKGYANVTDVGCGFGNSSLTYLDNLDPNYIDRVYLTLVDLSRQNLWTAIDKLEERGFKLAKNLFPIHSRDIDMISHIKQNSQDVVINVAGIHANAYMERAFMAISSILTWAGYFVSGDWHHKTWEHPAYMYQLLDRMDARHFGFGKGALMDEFASLFPKAKEQLDLSKISADDRKAMEDIENYWTKGWAEVRLEKIQKGLLLKTDEQIVLEGHRPAKEYVKEGSKYCLSLDDEARELSSMKSNPEQVVPGSNLNMVMVMKKHSSHNPWLVE